MLASRLPRRLARCTTSKMVLRAQGVGRSALSAECCSSLVPFFLDVPAVSRAGTGDEPRQGMHRAVEEVDQQSHTMRRPLNCPGRSRANSHWTSAR